MGFQHDPDQSMMSEINVTPLVDVMLVLLIVFIVTAPLLFQSMPVQVPKTAATTPLAQAPHVMLAIDREGRLFLDQRLVRLDDLKNALLSAKGGGPDLDLRIQADADASFGAVARAMAIAQQAGLEKISLVTLPQ